MYCTRAVLKRNVLYLSPTIELGIIYCDIRVRIGTIYAQMGCGSRREKQSTTSHEVLFPVSR